MELRHLFTFIAVVQEGNFTRAAEKLGYAQSSVTAQIQALEVELETPLFDRLGKKNILTDAGQRLLPFAHEITKLGGSRGTSASVGSQNVVAAMGAIEKLGLKLISFDTGGEQGRKIFFYSGTGEVYLRPVKKSVK